MYIYTYTHTLQYHKSRNEYEIKKECLTYSDSDSLLIHYFKPDHYNSLLHYCK